MVLPEVGFRQVPVETFQSVDHSRIRLETVTLFEPVVQILIFIFYCFMDGSNYL